MKIKLCLLLVLCASMAQAAERVWPRWEGWELMGSDVDGVFRYQLNGQDRSLVIAAAGKSGAIRKDAGQALTPDLELSWQWQVAAIPSTFAEDTQEKHHYLAVSVIFDNGKDLSYIWSATLPREDSFQCPLDDWKDKETHVVVETGPARFNQTVSYRRNIMADYARFIGGSMPAKVSKVWIVVLAKGGEESAKARITKLTIESAGHAPIDYL
jgi:hypothetical protein